ncbi:MAG: hypothetical protein J7474_04100, partial [Arthrobacter sp.]|nr:hypothetical protein [Arthrobacter sp.]
IYNGVQHFLDDVAANPQHEIRANVTARAAACDGAEGPDGEIPDHAACHLYQQDWGIPVVLSADGDTELVLDLRGMD